MKINFKFLNNIKFSIPVFLICLLLISFFIISFSLGKNLLGGEGNYFLNFSGVSALYGYSWIELIKGTGFSNPIINYSTFIFDFFGQLEKFGLSQSQMTIFKLLFLYLLPFAAMYWLTSRVLKNNQLISVFVSFFYIINPFSVYHIQGMMFWNVAPLFIWPLFFGIIYKNFYNWKKLFFIFGICSSILAFSFANIPYLGLFQIFLVFSILAINITLDKKIILSKVIKLFLVLEISFILFNSWWFVNLIRFQTAEIGNYYVKSFAIDWAKNTINDVSIISRIFSFRAQLPYSNTDYYYYYFTNFYNNFLVSFLLFIPFFLFIWSLLKNKKQNFLLIFFSCFILLVSFLNKGVNPPLSWLYVFFLETIPFFIVFKSPLEKFSLFLVFVFAISLPYIFKNADQKISVPLFSLYLFFCAIPFISWNFIPDNPIGDGRYVSRIFVDKGEYRFFRNKINSEKIYYRLFSLPGSLNYQVTMLNHDGKYYRGMDPLMYSTNKPFIAAYTGTQFNYLFENLSNGKNANIMSLYGIKYILINKDIYPSFSFRESENIKELEQIFSLDMKKIQNGSLILFKNNKFLPHFYTPQTLISTNQATAILPEIVSQNDYNIRSAIYFNNISKVSTENKEVINFNPYELKKDTVKNTPVIEFKKINPTKYRIAVHGARGEFPLVFNESFHEGWKIYLTKSNTSSKFKVQSSKLDDYKILDGNEDDQADVEELKSFIEKGYISTLGSGKEKEIKHQKWEGDRETLDYVEKYKIDFVSKNFQDTIQNDNLPSGQFYETWFKKPILDNKNHLMVNGYANSWQINTDKLCSVQSNCKKNSDGSYDFDVVVEFWPQRLFYIGLFISGTTLIFCLLYLTLTGTRRRGKIGKEGEEEFIIKKLVT